MIRKPIRKIITPPNAISAYENKKSNDADGSDRQKLVKKK